MLKSFGRGYAYSAAWIVLKLLSRKSRLIRSPLLTAIFTQDGLIYSAGLKTLD